MRAHHDEEEAQAAERELKRIKGYLWNGNHRDALTCIEGLANDLDDREGLPTTYPGIKAFRKGVDEFRTYVRRNAHTIASYAERHRYGERVSTAFAESTVNAVVGKRFAKRQQMRWSKRGAHLMLQTRTRVLDGTLRAKFQSWYPGLFHVQTPDRSEHDLAACPHGFWYFLATGRPGRFPSSFPRPASRRWPTNPEVGRVRPGTIPQEHPRAPGATPILRDAFICPGKWGGLT